MINKIKFYLKSFKLRTKLFVKSRYYENTLKINSKFKKCVFFIVIIVTHPFSYIKSLVNKELNIKYIEIVLTTVCTLNCHGCSALMEYYDHHEHISLDVIIKSMDRLLESVHSIAHLRLLGGEPLTYPSLDKLLIYLKKQNKIKKITIVTNGTLLINNLKIFDIIKNDRFDFYISNYGKNSYKINELINQLNKHGINYTVSSIDILWRGFGKVEYHNRNKKALSNQYSKCRVKCTSLINGCIHHCPRSSHGTNLNLIKCFNNDFIDLLDENIDINSLKIKLYNFFYKYTAYVNACNYCNNETKELKMISAGEQCKKKDNNTY